MEKDTLMRTRNISNNRYANDVLINTSNINTYE